MLVTLLFVECGSFHGDLAEIKRKWKIFSGPIYCSLCYTGLSSPVFFSEIQSLGTKRGETWKREAMKFVLAAFSLPSQFQI